MSKINEYKEILEKNPGDIIFADFAHILRINNKQYHALDVLLKGLSANPHYHRGRLVLAQLFFDMGHTSFAVRELRELCIAMTDNKYVRKLLEKLDPHNVEKFLKKEQNKDELESESTNKSGEVDIHAEVEFDSDDLDLFDDE